MFWTIIALGMTVLMGGIIAYNGDVIGRKYGKKRLTLFGLRPTPFSSPALLEFSFPP